MSDFGSFRRRLEQLTDVPLDLTATRARPARPASNRKHCLVVQCHPNFRGDRPAEPRPARAALRRPRPQRQPGADAAAGAAQGAVRPRRRGRAGHPDARRGLMPRRTTQETTSGRRSSTAPPAARICRPLFRVLPHRGVETAATRCRLRRSVTAWTCVPVRGAGRACARGRPDGEATTVAVSVRRRPRAVRAGGRPTGYPLSLWEGSSPNSRRR